MTENDSFMIYKTYVTNKKLQSFLQMVTLELRDQLFSLGRSLDVPRSQPLS